MQVRPSFLIAAAAVGGALLWVAYQKGAKGTGQAIGGAVVNVADGIFGGVVEGVGGLVGVPKTNETECEKAKREGRTWDASFACPAGDFLRYVWN